MGRTSVCSYTSRDPRPVVGLHNHEQARACKSPSILDPGNDILRSKPAEMKGPEINILRAKPAEMMDPEINILRAKPAEMMDPEIDNLQPSAGRQSAALPPSRSSGAIAEVASLSLTCFAIRDEACVAPCTNTIAIERARSSGSLGATRAAAFAKRP